ncbi:hypothetical protein ncot_01240 [Nocardioides sp. JQ2195]|uniref:hypothetical protein n=1 Tax=Nocardioides sp. JQ2195 TaxID=2592334 RepID=UPI00143E39C5|nr:hypothetical protein [Nocardioides sp. JQ2195]QIX25363.1 hypothetical protein ncot_01240 [Nocardioides sp. JQ2195]
MHLPRLPGPLSFLLVLVACVLLPLALVSSWTATTVSDTDEYVETVTPLASDRAVLTAVRKELKVVAVRAMATTPLAGQQTSQIDAAIRRVIESERFRTAWADGNRQVHEQVIAVLEDNSSRVDTADGVVSVDLGPLVSRLVDQLDANGIATPAEVNDLDASIPLMKTSDLEQARGGYQLLAALGFWLPVTWIALVVIVLLLARRRVAALGHLAIGSLLTLGILAAGLVLARQLVTERSPDGPLAQAVWDVVLHPLWTTLWVAAIVAGAVLVLRIVLGLVLRTARPR